MGAILQCSGLCGSSQLELNEHIVYLLRQLLDLRVCLLLLFLQFLDLSVFPLHPLLQLFDFGLEFDFLPDSSFLSSELLEVDGWVC